MFELVMFDGLNLIERRRYQHKKSANRAQRNWEALGVEFASSIVNLA